ncbi:hypothetical protein EDD21DRAFT_376647 [Dissophora ornata]|nr:hypothetical protein BGZ58_007411 [Dissophora ornata]KAI8600616.1 hypothetical protein EDD21DRAFT_376647 [Dissophora ornata]
MSLSISPSVESLSTANVFPTKIAFNHHDDQVNSENPADIEPLGTTASVPSSDDGHDDDDEDVQSTDDNSTNNTIGGTDAVVPTISTADTLDIKTSFAEGELLQESAVSTPRSSIVASPVSAKEVTKKTSKQFDDEIKKEDLVRNKKSDESEEAEPRKSISRPMSRQELRRKSSFFNSKDIAISDQRFSSSASASMRPIADPRFKSRFQSVLSQWKARDSN